MRYFTLLMSYTLVIIWMYIILLFLSGCATQKDTTDWNAVTQYLRNNK